MNPNNPFGQVSFGGFVSPKPLCNVAGGERALQLKIQQGCGRERGRRADSTRQEERAREKRGGQRREKRGAQRW